MAKQLFSYTDGTVVHWYKLERPNIIMDNGHITHFTFAVTDVDKGQITDGSNHGNKVIVMAFDGVSFDAETGVAVDGGAGGSSGTDGGGGMQSGSGGNGAGETIGSWRMRSDAGRTGAGRSAAGGSSASGGTTLSAGTGGAGGGSVGSGGSAATGAAEPQLEAAEPAA